VSKLAERIRNATRLQPQPLGFMPARAAVQASMVLAALAPDASSVAELADRGADVVIVGSADAPARLDGNVGGKDSPIVGAWVAGSDPDEAKRFREAGYDFVVFDPDRASATSLLDDSVGYILRLPSDVTDIEVRALEAFRLDAIDVGEIATPLTVRRQIDLQRLSALTRKTLMSRVDVGISAGELQALRDSNVPLVAVAGAEAVETLRRAIDALPPRTRRKDEGGDRPLPFLPRTVGIDAEDDEHEHDE
jgi:hypothetical protein